LRQERLRARLEELGKTSKAVSRVEKRGTKEGSLELGGFQGVTSLAPPRATEPKRYLDSLPDILTVEEVSMFLGISVSTVRDYLREGTMHGVKLGRGWKISKSSLERFVKELLG
jgi:excisionase family DNA binding protein